MNNTIINNYTNQDIINTEIYGSISSVIYVQNIINDNQTYNNNITNYLTYYLDSISGNIITINNTISNNNDVYNSINQYIYDNLNGISGQIYNNNNNQIVVNNDIYNNVLGISGRFKDCASISRSNEFLLSQTFDQSIITKCGNLIIGDKLTAPALLNKTQNGSNVIIGYRNFASLTTSTLTSNNVCIGSGNLSVNAGGTNIAIGNTNLIYSTKNLNIAIGNSILNNCIIGTNNIAFGNGAGYNINGSYNVAIGCGAGHNNNNSYSNSVSLGAFSTVTGNNQIMLGTGNETVYCPNALIVGGVDVMSTLNNTNNTLNNTNNSLSGLIYTSQNQLYNNSFNQNNINNSLSGILYGAINTINNNYNTLSGLIYLSQYQIYNNLMNQNNINGDYNSLFNSLQIQINNNNKSSKGASSANLIGNIFNGIATIGVAAGSAFLFSSLFTSVATLQAQVGQIQTELFIADDQIESCFGQIRQLQTTVASLQAQNEELQLKCAFLNGSIYTGNLNVIGIIRQVIVDPYQENFFMSPTVIPQLISSTSVLQFTI